MKQFLLAAVIMVFSISSFAQIKSANLTASGLTCSMCSKAIYKSLVKVPIIEDVKVDIENSSYLITFKQGAVVSPDVLRKAVENAGFSVASLKVTAKFDKTEIGPDTKLSFQGSTYRFISNSKQIIEGLKTFAVVDKNYLSSNEHKKYAQYISSQPDAGSVYHVTLL